MQNETNSAIPDYVDLEMIQRWEKKLMSYTSGYTKLIDNDVNIDYYNLSYKDERIVVNDCDRTRTKEREGSTEFVQLLKKLLIYYCKYNDIDYKQGLNEILGPLLLLKTKFDITIPNILNIFSCFIDSFLTNYYHEPELYAFRSSVSLLTLLLKYHDPTLFSLFENSSISPQMYATNWLLTTYANKHKLEIVYKLWDILIEENDQLMIHFIVIAFLQYNREELLDNDFSTLPLMFSKMSIKTLEALEEIVEKAKKIRDNTPYSFRILVNKLEIFKPRSLRLKELYEKYNTEEMISFPFLPSEILFNLYKDEVGCVDNSCANFLKNGSTKNQQECYFCKKGIQLQHRNFVLVDLRIYNESKGEVLNEGYLNNMDKPILSQEKLLKDDVGAILYEELKDSKDKAHIILLTKDTNYFNEYEEKFYYEKKTGKEQLRMLCGDISKFQKELNEKEVKIMVKEDKSHKLRVQLKEYENIKNIISMLQEKEFSFVSYSLGGFKSLHEACLKYNLQINKHNESKCDYCISDKNKNETIECYSKIFRKKKAAEAENSTKKSPSNVPVIPATEVIPLIRKVESKPKEEKEDSFKVPIDEISVERMNKYLNDKENTVFHCLLNEHNLFKYDIKIVLIVFFDKIKIFKMKRQDNKIMFDVIDEFSYEEIKRIKRDQTIFHLFYNNKSYHDLKLDLYSDVDADSFNDFFTQIVNDNNK